MSASPRTVILVLVMVLSPLTLVFGGAAHANTASRTQCFSQCVSCEQHCHREQSCVRMCLQLKRQCCQAGGNGPGPNLTCSCT